MGNKFETEIQKPCPTRGEQSQAGGALAPPRGARRLQALFTAIRRSDEFWYYLSKLIAGAFSFLSILFLVRLLGEREYGLYAVGVAAATVASLFSSGWATHALLRSSGSRRADSLPHWLRSASFAVGGLTAVVIAVASTGPAGFEPAWIATAAVLGIALSMQYLTSVDLLSIQDARYYARSEFLKIAGGAVLALVGALATREPSVALGGLALAAVLAAVRPRSVVPQVVDRLPPAEVLAWWSYGWPMALWFALSTLLQFGGRFIVSALIGIDAAGYYSAAYDTVTRATTMVLFPLVMASHPRIMSLWNEGHYVGAQELCRSLARRLCWVSVVVLVGGLAISPFAVQIIGLRPVGGDTFIIAALLVGGLLWQAALVVHKPLEILGKTRHMFGAIAVAVVVNLGSAALFVPRFGVLAAAVATVAGAAAYILLVLPAWWKFLRPANHVDAGVADQDE